MSGSPNLEKTPSIVGGKVERFSDIGEMITQWERIEQDYNEWMVVEGMRRGGRKLSKRTSKLLGIFGEGEKDSIVELETGGTFAEDNISSLPSISSSLSSVKDNMSVSSRKLITVPIINLNCGRNKMLL